MFLILSFFTARLICCTYLFGIISILVLKMAEDFSQNWRDCCMMQKLNCCQDFLEGRSTTSIRRWRLIKKSRFWVGVLLKCDRNFPSFCSKKPQKVDFWAKKWWFIQNFIEFSCSGGLIKSGVVYVRIR